jgi:hypothetical protein
VPKVPFYTAKLMKQANVQKVTSTLKNQAFGKYELINPSLLSIAQIQIMLFCLEKQGWFSQNFLG